MVLPLNLSTVIIGRLSSVIHSDVCIEKLVPHLYCRKILTHGECDFYVSPLNCPNARSTKVEQLTQALSKAANRPRANWARCLYLALLDSFDEEICGSNECLTHHRVANYLRKQGN